MQECDREREAHAREAEDVTRMMTLLRTRSADPQVWLPAFELGRAKARWRWQSKTDPPRAQNREAVCCTATTTPEKS